MKLLGIVLILLSLTACTVSQMANIQGALIQLDDVNANRVLTLMNQVMKHWGGNSAFWKIQIGAKLQDDDHYKLRTAWLKLDEIYTLKYLPACSLSEVDAFESFSWFLKWGVAGGQELGFTLLTDALALAAKLGIKDLRPLTLF